MTINRQWLLAERPAGMVGPHNFKYTETAIPEPKNKEVLVKNLFLSFDPAQRNWMVDRKAYLPPVAIGDPMRAGSVGQVIDSRHAEYQVGDLVQTTGNWQDYVVASPGEGPMGLVKLPSGVSPEMMLSVLGITGLTAYFGLLEIGQPKLGDTVLVSGAAGSTGSFVGQIAKIKGCRVVGIAGGPDKCRWLKETAGFDAVIDYKNEDVNAQIAHHCPDKWDVFFDNVGGSILEAALDHVNLRSRIVLCGSISGYNATRPIPGPSNLSNLTVNRARMEGFVILDYMPRAMEAIQDLMSWVSSGELIYQVDVQEGFENIPTTLQRLYNGKNLGKQLLKIDL